MQREWCARRILTDDARREDRLDPHVVGVRGAVWEGINALDVPGGCGARRTGKASWAAHGIARERACAADAQRKVMSVDARSGDDMLKLVELAYNELAVK